MNNDRRSFLGLLLRAGQEAVKTLVHEGVGGAVDRLEITLDRFAQNHTPSEVEPVPSPEEDAHPEPLTVRPVLWPGYLAQGFTKSLAPDQYDWIIETELSSLEAQVAAGHLALLPLNTGMNLVAHGLDLYLLGVVGPELAALISADDTVNSWLDLMWNWAAVSAEHPALYPLAYHLSGGEGTHLVGCFGVLPEGQILDLLESGRIKVAVLSGEALTKALTIPGMRIAIDLTAEAAAVLPGAPWGPLTGLFATGEALQRAPEAVQTLVKGYSTTISGDQTLEFVPAEVCRPWVEALLGQDLLHQPVELLELLS